MTKKKEKNLGGRPPKYSNNKVLSKKIDEYFLWCDSQLVTLDAKIIYKPYTISGMCLYLDITRETLCEYQKLEMFSDTIKKAKNKIENWLEEHSLSGDTNPAVSIFNLKNNFKWTDKTETDITSKGDKIENNNIVNIELSDRVRHLEAK